MLINKKLLSVSLLSFALLGGSENTVIASATYQVDLGQVLLDLNLEMGRLAERQEKLLLESKKPLSQQQKAEIETEMHAISEALETATQMSEKLQDGKGHAYVCPTKQVFESREKELKAALGKVVVSGEKIEDMLDKSTQLGSLATKFKESSKKEGLLGSKVGNLLTGLGRKCGIIK